MLLVVVLLASVVSHSLHFYTMQQLQQARQCLHTAAPRAMLRHRSLATVHMQKQFPYAGV
jgi:hypothetical protein